MSTLPARSRVRKGAYELAAQVTFAPEWSPVGVGRRVPFRSSLEAKWARFLSALHVPWAYEPETFPLEPLAPNVRRRRYTPDFRLELAGGVAWVEVKPHYDAALAVAQKLESFGKLAQGRGERFFVFAAAEPTLGLWAGQPSVLEVFGETARSLGAEEATRTVVSPGGRALLECGAEVYGRHVELARDRCRRDDGRPTLAERFFVEAVAAGRDFNALRRRYLAG